VQSLLLRLGVVAGVSRIPQAAGRAQFHVRVTGVPDRQRFVSVVGAVGARRTAAAEAIRRHAARTRHVTNRDVLPAALWRSMVGPARSAAGLTERAFQQRLGMSYCGSTLYRSNLGRERAARVADVVGSSELRRLAEGDIYWDRVASIEPDGTEEVYDLTVDRLHNFVADDIVVHNSIEQDADLVMFIYRDEYYDRESEREGIADVIISKHRNGGLGTIELTFQKDYPRFMSYIGDDRY
jgi:replicative DNA helicase